MDIRFTINETNYQLTSDEYQVIINEVKVTQNGKNKGKEYFRGVGFYGNAFQALSHLLDREIYKSECKTMGELEKRYTDTLNKINELIDVFKIK